MTRTVALLVALALTAPPLLVGLGSPDLVDPDEGRYAWAARVMARDGLSITPWFNGEPRFAKPAPLTWLQALSLRALGENERALRLPGALLALGAVLVVFRLGADLGGPWAGLAAALVLGTGFRFVAIAHQALVDAPLQLAMAGMMAGLARFTVAAPQARPRLLLEVHLWMALGVLVKGPVAVLLGGLALGLYALWARRPRLLAGARPGTAVLVLLICTVPYFAAVTWTHGMRYLREAVLKEQLMRAVSPGFGQPRGRGAGYFLGVVPADTMPWWPAIAVALVVLAIRWRSLTTEEREPLRLCLAWAAAVIGFFSVARYKLPHYVLPAYPALAVMAGVVLGRWPSRAVSRFAVLAGAAVLAIALIGSALYLGTLGEEAFVLLVLAAAAALLVLVPGARAPLLALGVLVAATYVVLEVKFIPGLGRRFRPERALAAAVPEGARVGVHGPWSSAFIHYLGRPVRVVGEDELAAFAREPGPAVLLTREPPPEPVRRLAARRLATGEVLTPRLVDLWRSRPPAAIAVYELAHRPRDP